MKMMNLGITVVRWKDSTILYGDLIDEYKQCITVGTFLGGSCPPDHELGLNDILALSQQLHS